MSVSERGLGFNGHGFIRQNLTDNDDDEIG